MTGVSDPLRPRSLPWSLRGLEVSGGFRAHHQCRPGGLVSALKGSLEARLARAARNRVVEGSLERPYGVGESERRRGSQRAARVSCADPAAWLPPVPALPESKAPSLLFLPDGEGEVEKIRFVARAARMAPGQHHTLAIATGRGFSKRLARCLSERLSKDFNDDDAAAVLFPLGDCHC